MGQKEISRATLGRIPVYLKYIEDRSESAAYISSTTIARELGLGEVQVRKDLSLLCGSGKPKVGYERKTLVKSLKAFLDAENGGAVIVGAGKLGQALLDYRGFEIYGTKILAAFDNHPQQERFLHSGKPIYPLAALEEFCKQNDVRIGIIATPAEAGQEVLNRLIGCGIKKIWCLAPCRLHQPADVTIRYENLALSLAHLKL